MSLEMIPVQSSMFSALGFNATTEEIYAKFTSGTLGAYGPATRDELNAVLNDKDGIGRSFNRLIKPTKRYRKVEAEEIPVAQQQGGLDDGPPNSIIDRVALYVKPASPEVLFKPSDPEAMADVAAAQEANRLVVEGYIQPTVVSPDADAELVLIQAADIAARANSLEILDDPTHVAAQEVLVAIAETRTEVIEFFKPLKKAAHEAHKAICDRENLGLSPLKEAQDKLSKSIVTFRAAQEAARKAEQEKLRLAEQARLDQIAKEESERLALEDAIALEAEGDTAGAEMVLANPLPVAPMRAHTPIVPTSVSRVTGSVEKTVWRGTVVNAALIPREYLMVNDAAIQAYAAKAGEFANIPGVEFAPVTSIHGRRSK